MVAHLLCLVREVVGVHADAVSAHQTGPEAQEVPLGARRRQHLAGVDAEFVEQQRQLVDERDVDVALGVLDDLRGLGDADRRRSVGARGDDLGVEGVHKLGRRRGGAGGDLEDVRQAVLVVARVDALGGVAQPEVGVDAQPRLGFEDRSTDLLGGARVDRRLVDHHVAGCQRAPDGAARGLQRREVRPTEPVDGGRDGHDVDVHVGESGRVRAEGQAAGRGCRRLGTGGQAAGQGRSEVSIGHLQRAVVAAAQLRHPRRVDVEPDHGQDLGELHGNGQPHIAQADHGHADRYRIRQRRAPRCGGSGRVRRSGGGVGRGHAVRVLVTARGAGRRWCRTTPPAA